MEEQRRRSSILGSLLSSRCKSLVEVEQVLEGLVSSVAEQVGSGGAESSEIKGRGSSSGLFERAIMFLGHR